MRHFIKGLFAAFVILIALAQPSVARSYLAPNIEYSQQEIQGFFEASGNAYLAENAATFAAMSYNVESGGNSAIYNGSCCTGLMQMNQSNLRTFCNCTPAEYAAMSGQEQINIYARYYESIANASSVQTLLDMQANGQSLGGYQVDGAMIAACIQLGVGNCQKSINNGCSGVTPAEGGDGHVNICTMAAKANGGSGGVGGGGGGASGGMCLQIPIMSQAGERATSPFGVDRTGRASAGYHLGLDLVNSAGAGDPIYAGVPGRVVYAQNNATNSVFVETSDGSMRFGYLHGNSINVRVDDEVQNNTQVITMGDTGSKGAVHLHLYTALSGDLVKSMGEAAGVVWPLADGDFWGDKRSGGLSGAGLAESAPAPFYMVNPETYLHHRVPFAQDVLNSEQYRRQGFSRPDGMTLEPTCAPPPDFFSRGPLRSDNGGSTVNGGMAATGQAAGSNPQTLVNMAASDGRDAIIQRGLSSIGETTRNLNYGQSRRTAASVWAGMIFAFER